MGKKDVFLEIKDLSVAYDTDEGVVYAVNGVSFSMEHGETLGIVGETGAGKTTIARSILRILPEPPAVIRSGEIFFRGENLLEMGETEMRKKRGSEIAMIFQDPMSALNPTLTVGEQISESIRIHQNVGRAEALKRGMQMLEIVGIPSERYYNYPHEFSGGMKQRVVIAIALACNPHLLLADEPTTALDVTIQAQVLDMMEELKNKYNTAMILITHDLGVVGRMCDDVAVIYAGEVLEYGTKEEIFLHPCHPYTVGLFGAIPDLSVDTRRLANIEGLPPDPTDLPKGCCFNPRCPYATEECRQEKSPLAEVRPNHLCSCRYWNKVGKES